MFLLCFTASPLCHLEVNLSLSKKKSGGQLFTFAMAELTLSTQLLSGCLELPIDFFQKYVAFIRAHLYY